MMPVHPVMPPGESLDEMKLLEEQARRIAEEAGRDQPKKPAKMTFVKYETLYLVAMSLTQCPHTHTHTHAHTHTHTLTHTHIHTHTHAPTHTHTHTCTRTHTHTRAQHYTHRSDEASQEMEDLARATANLDEIELASSGEESEGEEAQSSRKIEQV